MLERVFWGHGLPKCDFNIILFTCYFVVFVVYIPDCSEMKSFHGTQDVPNISVQCLRGC